MGESIQCWQCGTRMTLDELANNDGDCPRCEVEVHLAEYLDNALSKVATLEAELATVKKVAYGNMELLEENAKLRAELAAFKSAVDHVTADGKTTRSFSASEGWAMVHMDRLTDLHVVEERLSELERRAVPDGWRELLQEVAEYAPPYGTIVAMTSQMALGSKARRMLAAAPSAPKADDPVKVQLLEALTDSLELMETLCAFEGDTIRKARAAIAAARKGESK